jgi:hypothetical protein
MPARRLAIKMTEGVLKQEALVRISLGCPSKSESATIESTLTGANDSRNAFVTHAGAFLADDRDADLCLRLILISSATCDQRTEARTCSRHLPANDHATVASLDP